MYADDLLLLSISITDMQQLIDICCENLAECDLLINSRKTTCVRIGPRHCHTDCDLYLNGDKLIWKSEVKYLGINILSGRNFRCNLQPVRQKFYRSVNGIFGKIYSTNNPTVILSLINSCCMPVLLYGLEALQLNSSSIDSINFMYSSVFSKVFKTKDKNTIKLCKYYSEICQHRVL